MRLSCSARDLRDAVAAAAAVVPTTPELVAYGGVRLRVRGGELAATGTDGATTITASVDVDDGEDGDALLPPRALLDLLAALPDGAALRLRRDGDELELRRGDHAPYRLRLLEATFPDNAPSRSDPAEVDWQRLNAAVRAIRHAVDRDGPGVQLVSVDDGGDARLCAANPYRVAAATLRRGGFGDFSGVLPLAVLDRAAALGVGEVAADRRGHTLWMGGQRASVETRLRADPFPNVDHILDARPDHHVDLDVADALDALKPVASVAAGSPLTCELSTRQLVLRASNVAVGEGEETVGCGGGPSAPLRFGMDAAFLRDALAAHRDVGADQVALHYDASLQPFYLVSDADVPLVTVMMPVNLAA